jgi:galactokinase
MANGRCRMHGGSTPSGIALPQTTTGRYSKHLPTRMLSRYEQARTDSELLALRDEVSVIDARLADVLGRVDTGESGRLWLALKTAWRDYRRAKPADKARAEMAVADLISDGVSDTEAWQEVRDLIDQRARLVASERQRLVQLQQMLTTEQAMTLLGAVAATIREHVHDRAALAAISADLGRLVAHEAGRGSEPNGAGA